MNTVNRWIVSHNINTQNTAKVSLGSVGTIRCALDHSSVIVYKDGRSLLFSNNRIFSFNLTFPDAPQYRIFLYILGNIA